jgi:hypothetical protein
MEAAVKGTLNILEVCSSMKVHKVVVVHPLLLFILTRISLMVNPKMRVAGQTKKCAWKMRSVMLEFRTVSF